MEKPHHISEESLIDAVEGGQLENVRYLLENGVNIECRDGDGRSMLVVAIQAGHHELCHFLLEQGASANQQDEFGNGLLHIAARQARAEIISTLLEYGLEVDTVNREGVTPLVLALLRRDDKTMRELLEAGASILDLAGERNPLFYICEMGDTQSFRLFYEYLEKRNQLVEVEKSLPTLYSLALSVGAISLLDFLHEKFSIDPDYLFSPKEEFKFFLHRLYRQGDEQEYLSRFIQLESPHDYEVPVLAWAVAFGHLSAVDFLLKKEISVDVPIPPQGATPLMWAVVAGHQKLVEQLLLAKANSKIKDQKGRSAIDLLESYGHFFSHRLILKTLRSQ